MVATKVFLLGVHFSCSICNYLIFHLPNDSQLFKKRDTLNTNDTEILKKKYSESDFKLAIETVKQGNNIHTTTKEFHIP